MRETVTWSGLSGSGHWRSSPMDKRTISACKAAGRRREVDMSRWRDFQHEMRTELLLLAYVIAWVIVLFVTHMLTE
jgi:hypothetical protein